MTSAVTIFGASNNTIEKCTHVVRSYVYYLLKFHREITVCYSHFINNKQWYIIHIYNFHKKD